MKKTLKTLALLSLTATIFVACQDDDDTNSLSAPAAYTFERNGMSSVAYTGQTQRILMAEELLDGMKDTSTSLATLQAQFDHQQGQNNFNDASLNASSKSVRSKVAASTDLFSANVAVQAEIREDFDEWIEDQVDDVFPVWNSQVARPGIAGYLDELGGGSTRYFNEGGLEYDQAVAKGLIGALMADQMLNNYLSTSVLDAGTNREDNDNQVLVSGKNYTNMEHKWDEAFGYLYGTDNALDPQLNADSFLNKYLQRVENDEDFTGIAADIYDAFKLGRTAIVAGDYELRDAQADIIREKVSIVIAKMAVFYLIEGKEVRTTDMAAGLHDFSEGFGFIYSLQFTREPGTGAPYFSNAEVNGFINTLTTGNGLWDLTDAQIDAMASSIASRFDFTVAEAWR
jgi:hypothetical protein